ncbi:MAG: hypothetical protein QXP81_09385 [Nitrososphaerota archaeon]
MRRYVKGPYKCDYCGGVIANEEAEIEYSWKYGVLGRYHIKCVEDQRQKEESPPKPRPRKLICELCNELIIIEDMEKYDEYVHAHIRKHNPKAI